MAANKLLGLKPLHLVCINNEEAPNQSLIQIRRNNATAYNGSVLVKVDLKRCQGLTEDDLDILNGKFIHMEVWREMWECDELEILPRKIVVYTDGIKKILEYNTPSGEFYDADEIILEIKKAGEDAKRLMCYDTKNIQLVSQVLGVKQLFFSFTKGGKGTVVFPHDDCGMFAIIAPIPNLDKIEVPRYLFVD